MSGESFFETFCAAHSLQQRQEGVEVPTRQSHSFAYYQWLEVAKRRFQESHAEAQQQRNDVPASQRVKVEGVTSLDNAVLHRTEDALATRLAAQLASSLEKQFDPLATPAALRHATQEIFPMPRESMDLPSFLAIAEATVRLTLWHVGDARLAQMAARMRPNLRLLEERGVLRAQAGCFPGLQLLMDLLSFRIIAHHWNQLTPEMRAVAVEGMQTLCGCLQSPAAAAMKAAVQLLDVTADTTAVPLPALHQLLAQMSAAIPFEFAACRDLATLYPEPTGVLRVPGTANEQREDEPQEQGPERRVSTPSPPPKAPLPVAPDVVNEGAASPAKSADLNKKNSHTHDPDDFRLGDLLSPRISAEASPFVAPATALQVFTPHAVLEVVPRASGGRLSASATRRLPTKTVKGHPACVSPFHARYADPAKHASAECRYCATCHLMEILFRGEKRDCSWHHWPNKRKIQLHLKRFHRVYQLALKRLGEMERGEQLAATDEVPF